MSKKNIQLSHSSSLFFTKMNSDCRKFLKRHMLVQLEKEPEISTAEMVKWIKTGRQEFDFTQVKAITLFQFVNRNMKMFREWGTLDRKKGSGGGNKTPGRIVGRIKRLMINKRWRSSRGVCGCQGWSLSHDCLQCSQEGWSEGLPQEEGTEDD